MKLSFHQLPRLVPLRTLHQRLGHLHTLPWCWGRSCGGRAEHDGHEPTGSLNNFVFPSSLRGSSSSPMVSENEEATVAVWRCLMFLSFHKHHVLPCNLRISPASPGNVFMSNCEYFWALRNGGNDYGNLTLCRAVSNVKLCYANHVNELSHFKLASSLNGKKQCCVKPPSEHLKRGHGLLLKGNSSPTLISHVEGAAGGRGQVNRHAEIEKGQQGGWKDGKEENWSSSAWEENTGGYVFQQHQQMVLAGQASFLVC